MTPKGVSHNITGNLMAALAKVNPHRVSGLLHIYFSIIGGFTQHIFNEESMASSPNILHQIITAYSVHPPEAWPEGIPELVITVKTQLAILPCDIPA
jgi:hypothetical protein